MFIYCIGDSHTGVFTHKENPNMGDDYDIPPFKQCYISGATAFHLKDDRSSSGSSIHLANHLSRVKPEDIVLMWFGEIDCRLHIYKKSKETGQTIDYLLDETIKSYGTVLDNLKVNNIRFAVFGLPPCNREQPEPDDETKRYIYRGFNQRLKAFCDAKGYHYIETMDLTADSNGFINPAYSRSTDCRWFYPFDQSQGDQVHLNHKIIPYVLEQINKFFGTRFHLEIRE